MLLSWGCEKGDILAHPHLLLSIILSVLEPTAGPLVLHWTAFLFKHWRLNVVTWPPPANSLTINMRSGGHGKKACLPSLGRWINWWTGQLWKIGSSIWGLSKVWLIYLSGSDGREGFPCFHSRQERQARGVWKEILCVFPTFMTLGLRVAKKESGGWGKKNVNVVRREDRKVSETVA